MRKVDKKRLYEDITVYVGRKLEQLNLEGWLDKELSEKTGIVQTRITEMKNFKKYKRPILEKYLAAFIGGGIVTTKEIIENVPMNAEGKSHVKDLEFYNNPEARILFKRLKDAGIDPIAALSDALKNATK
jgi:hypothetical protein